MEQIHVLVGHRPAYVANFHGAYPAWSTSSPTSTPSPIGTFEYDGSTLTAAQFKAYLNDFRTRILPHTQALLSYDLKTPEARYFLERYPHAQQIKLHYDNQDYFVLLR